MPNESTDYFQGRRDAELGTQVHEAYIAEIRRIESDNKVIRSRIGKYKRGIGSINAERVGKALRVAGKSSSSKAPKLG